MRDFEESTLWRVSEFERVKRMTGSSGFMRHDGASVLSSTLLADLRRLDAGGGASDDLLEVVAACLRHHEPALLCLQCDALVWPITLFPTQMLYHAPRDISETRAGVLSRATLLSAEPPGVRPPGHWMHERIAQANHYREMAPLLWTLAIDGPRSALLAEIAGNAGYRATKSLAEHGVTLSGALGSAAERLRRETVPLRTIAGWPGMSVERASRMLNGLYLGSALLVSRAHPAADPGRRGILRALSPRR